MYNKAKNILTRCIFRLDSLRRASSSAMEGGVSGELFVPRQPCKRGEGKSLSARGVSHPSYSQRGKGQYGFPIRSGMLVPGTDNKGVSVCSFAIRGEREQARRGEKGRTEASLLLARFERPLRSFLAPVSSCRVVRSKYIHIYSLAYLLSYLIFRGPRVWDNRLTNTDNRKGKIFSCFVERYFQLIV